MSSPTHTRWCGVAAAIAFSALACREPSPSPAGSVPAPAPIVSARPSALPSVPGDGGDFISQQIALRTMQYAPSLVPAFAALRGALPTGGTEAHPFDARPGHCYRIVAVGGVSADDLDLALFAPDGSEVDHDTEGDPFPEIGTTRPVCPPLGGRYRIEVHMAAGEGEYGVAVFRTP